MRVLATLLTPDAGRAEVFGRDVVGEAPAVRELLGLTGQFAAVDEILSGRENLVMFGRLFGLSRAEARRRADELLERFDLADAADRPARTYSGGMRRRLDLASSLLTQPRILFLDEPTTGLDPRSRNQIWAIVRELVREGTTLLLTTQYLEEADELADRIAVIDHGRVIAEGTGNELKERVGGQILEVELASAASARRGPERAARRGLRRAGAGRARRPAHAAGAPQTGSSWWRKPPRRCAGAGIGVSRPRAAAAPRSTTCSCSSPARRASEDGDRAARDSRRRPPAHRRRSRSVERPRRLPAARTSHRRRSCARRSPTPASSPAATCATSSASRSC